MEDFKKVLTFRLVTKIRKHFKGNVKLFYSVPKIWKKFKNHMLKEKDLNPFSLISLFNDAGLDRDQVKHIFGKYPGCKTFTIPYSSLITSDMSLSVKNYGMHKSGNKTIHHNNVYLLPFELVSSIFEDKSLLEKVCDAGSDYYTDRQRRLIFTQILKVSKNYHYKTNKQEADELTDEQKVEELLKEIDF